MNADKRALPTSDKPHALLTVWAAALSIAGCGSVSAQEGPPPPKYAPLEVFAPTPKSYSIASECQGRPFSMTWIFDGSKSSVGGARYDGSEVPTSEIERLNEGFEEIGGDVLVRLACNRGGVKLSLIDALSAGARRGANTIHYDFVDGKLREVMRNFFS